MGVHTVAVIGAGNGGLAAAADLTLRGFAVRLASRSADVVAAINEAGGITLQSPVSAGFAKIGLVTTDLHAAVRGADLVMLTVPATAIGAYGELLAPHLAPGQPVFLNPGGTGGALQFAAALNRGGYGELPVVGESSTLAYACRASGPTAVTISNIVPSLPFAAFPGDRCDELAAQVATAYPSVCPVANVLETGLANINAIEHPAQILMNAGWVEHTRGDFYFYFEGTTPAVGAVIDQVDRERLAIAGALDVTARPFVELFASAGYTTTEGAAHGRAWEAMQSSEANRWFRAPESLNHRYVHEDVGYGLVPWAEWAKLAGVASPMIDSLIVLASTANGIDYRSTGLTLERMGLAHTPVDHLATFLRCGVTKQGGSR